MKRIIIHWTGGSHSFNASDARHYHFGIDGDGKVHEGNLKPEANLDCTDGNYVAHTRRCNTGSIGVGVCGMHAARYRPFDPGQYPINHRQIDALAELCADLCETYRIPVTRETVLTHAEVQPTLGIRQRGKWDITWLPGLREPISAATAGNILRERIAEKAGQPPLPHPPPLKPGPADTAARHRAATNPEDPPKPPRTSPTQSTTVQASATQIAAGAGTAVTAVSALNGTAQIVALGLAAVIVLAGAWIMRERLRHWANGVR